MSRIAIVHYTALPSVGGIELLIDHQVEALTSLGHQVRLVVGEGATPLDSELILIPGLIPGNGSERALHAALSVALEGCDECWIHNLLTLTLHPTATAALLQLIRELSKIRWVAWCEDLSATSCYVCPAEFLDSIGWSEPVSGVTYVTISEARRQEIARSLSIGVADISVVRPPVHAVQWLGLGDKTIRLMDALCLQIGDPLVLVPSKILPHKNLDLVLAVCEKLRERESSTRVVVTGPISPHEPTRSRGILRDLRRQVEARSLTDTVSFVSETLGHAIGHDAVRDLMLLADLVFLPSTEEGYGMAVNESLALRTPVLCADIPAFRESGNGVPFYFSLLDDAGVIAGRITAICDLPGNRSRRAALGSYGRFREDIARLLATSPAQPQARA